MNKKTTKRALFLSFVSMFLCFTMLLGTTYAWFTDSVASDVNHIVSGNLDIELLHTNKKVANTTVDGGTELFTEVEKWEPGVMVWEKFTVQNVGDLALKYLFTLNANNATVVDGVSFADVLKVAVIDNENFDYTADRDAFLSNIPEADWDTLKTFTLDGTLDGKVENQAADEDTFGIVIYWEPSDKDNLFNLTKAEKEAGKEVSVDVGVNLFATQLEAEKDSFGPDYDKEAADKIAVTTTVKANEPTVLNAPVAPSTTNAVTTIEAPANAFGDNVKALEAAVTPTSSLFNVSADGDVVGSIDVELTAYDENGNVITNFDNALTSGVYTVTTYIAKGLANVNVAYNGDGNQPTITLVDYDAETGKLVFTTTHFSKYDVSGSALAYDLEADTAINDIKVIVAEQNKAESTVVVPTINSEAVAEAVEDAIAEGTIDEEDVDLSLVYVAKVGDEFFTSLDEAFAAIESEGTVVLNKDVSYTDKSFTIAGKKVTLNTNGKTLSDVSTASKTSYFFLVKNSATLTLTGNGTVSFRATTPDTNWGEGSTNKYPGYANNTFRNEGIIVVNGPTLENWTERGGASYVIDNYAGSSLTVESGVIAQRGDDIAIRTFATSATNGINVVVNGGELIGRRGIWVHLAGSDSAVAPKVDVTINGGKFTPSALALYSYSYGNSFANATIAINGGEFGGDIAFGGGYKGDVENVTFNKDNIKMAEGKTIIRYLNDADYDILNNVYYVYSDVALATAVKEVANVVLCDDIVATSTITVTKDVTLDLNGYTLSGTCNAGQGHLIMVNNGAKLTIVDSSEDESGKITYAQGTSNTGWAIDLEGELVLESGTIELTGDSWSIGYAVDVRPNAWGTAYTTPTVFTMKGGKLVSSDGALRVASSSSDKHEDVSAHFIMYGGEIEAAWDGVFVQQSNAAYDVLNVELRGGKITSALSPVRFYGPDATSVVGGVEKPMTLVVDGAELAMSAEIDTTRTWFVEGKVVLGGGMTADILNNYATITIK
ncbi:MAG: hypothetical protein IKB02_06140 [Clostridia bacterium]|nr:hypothetical protein [Clostridia bacterium]